MGYLDLLKIMFRLSISDRSLESSLKLQLENSLSHFQVAVDFNSQNESAWIGLVLVSSLKGNSERAHQAVNLMPNGNSKRGFLRSWFISQSIRYLAQNEPELSEQMLLISLRLLPGVHDSRYGLQYIRIGTALLKENRTQEAGQVLERGLKVDETYNDNQAIMYAYLGKIAFDDGEFERALKHFQMAVAIDPLNAIRTRWWIWDNQFHIGYILATQGQCSQAAVAYQGALHAATEETQIQTTQSELDRLPVSCHITGED
jgi:tetratricopeptide (TPR) repeat protein